MAVRTNTGLVEGIIEIDSAISLTPFIAAANSIVTQACTNLPSSKTPYTDEQLQTIETWLSAHFYTVREGRAFEERAGTVSERKQSAVDLGFNTSHYGQMAMRLDWHGGLAALDKKALKGNFKTPTAAWLGKTRAEADTQLGD
jgi:hypothetical protein